MINSAYFWLFIAAMFEGETFIFIMSSMAYRGSYGILNVFLITLFGSFFADQACFALGRFFGIRRLRKLGRYFLKSLRKKGFRLENSEEKTAQVFNLLNKHQTYFVLSFRFIYGIKTISPFIIGALTISRIKFAALNFAAALVWSFLSCSIGYLIGAMSLRLGGESTFVPVIINIFFLGMALMISHFVAKRSIK